MDPDWTASALFSPSKAAAQRAQAKDWAAVDVWLAKRYSSRLPIFERNEETLQALLILANQNESADEQRNQIERIEKTAFQALSKRQNGITDEVIQAMLIELANETHMDTLAESIVESDCPNSDVVLMAGKIIELTSTQFEMTEQVKRVGAQVLALRSEQERLRKLLDELRGSSFQPNGDLVEATAEWQKTTKHLRAKIGEYEERLSAIRPASTMNDIESIQRRSEDVANQRKKLANLEAQLRAYQDLPTDSRAARRKLEEARDRLQSLTSRRDEMFGELVRD